MSAPTRQESANQHSARNTTKSTLLATSALAILSAFTTAQAQDDSDEIVVTGIRGSLQNALVEKRNADNLKEVIQAEDIGKLPDQNLAEVLENITGIQITRTAGVGTAVQIRGTDENRTEINGVSTVGSGSGRGGISFEDLPASLIASVEVTKVPEASTIEGSVGGTINLRTLRPLELKDHVLSFRAQGEHSDLADSFLPRFSGAVGKNWSTDLGEFGVVVSGSYARQDVAAFRPRVDRDAVVLPGSGPSAEDYPFLRIQFFDQDYDNFEYSTLNFSGALEWKPTDNLKFYFDGIYNDQERTQESTRVQLSGVSAGPVIDNTTNTSFETIDWGTLDGPNGPVDLGSVQAALTGILEPGTNLTGARDPNLRTDSNTGARVTKSAVYRLGGEWENDRLSLRVEGSISDSDSVLPNFNTVLDFINPNHTPPSIGQSLDNGVPLEFDLRDGILQFGLAQGLPTTPTTAMLLDPANYAISQVQHNINSTQNRETAARFDVSYDTTDITPFVTSIDAGYRYNKTSAVNESATRNTNFTNTTSSFNRPRGDLFSDILVAGPDNFNAADGRRLYFGDFLVVDPALLFSDPAAVLASLNAAIAENNEATSGIDVPLIGEPTESAGAFFDISESTHAAYFQANFDTDGFGLRMRGNAGVRWVSTTVSSLGNTIVGGVTTPVVEEGSYDFFLPRFNLVIEPSEDFLIRAGVAKDINRPDFDDLSTSVTFGTGPNDPVPVGNPDLVPEAVWSFDISGEYYFAPASVVSIGFFHKIRTNLFSVVREDPAPNLVGNQLNIDITPPCEDGGIFNPIANRNINNPVQGVGICVPRVSTFNGEGTTTQTGVEFAFQYDLSEWEDQLGFASGFGFIGNYTFQMTGGSAQDFPSNFRQADGPRNVFTTLGIPGALDRITLENLSRHSYNATLFYEKYGVSARARYTWRSSYDAPADTDSFFFGLPRVNGARGQLNGSLSYAVNSNLSVGIEGANLLQADQKQYCVNNKALLCFQGLTDRRLIAGINLRF
ncbi:MAG: TonB-dependent receptor [Amphiplicatus sp.]